MYQIIECSSRLLIFETENLDRAIEQFELLQGKFEPCLLTRSPDIEISALILQKVERIDRWQRTA